MIIDGKIVLSLICFMPFLFIEFFSRKDRKLSSKVYRKSD